MGADVIKVEPPEGDTTRRLGPARHPGMGAFYLACNRNKRSLVLDLKQTAGRAALLRLAATADVILHNFRPGPAARLGLEYEPFRAVNPRLVYCATYGLRARGPFRTTDGYLAVVPYTDADWRAFFALAGRADLQADPRFRTLESRLANIEALYEELAKIIAGRSSAEWLEALDRASVPAMVVNTLETLLVDPQLEATGFWKIVEHPTEGTLRVPDIPTTYSRTPAEIRRLPPRLGEHSREVLREAGFSEAEVDDLRASGVTSLGPGP